MADTLLIRDGIGSTTINLLTGTFKLQNLDSNHPFLVGSDGVNPLQETFPLLGSGDPTTVLNPAQSALRLVEQGIKAWHRDKLLSNGWWIRWYINGESEKQALLMPGTKVNQAAAPGINPFSNEETKRLLRLTLVRHPLWENIGSTSVANTGMSCVGTNVYDIAVTGGDAPSRIYSTGITNASASGSLETFYIGIRPKYQASETSFTPAWPLLNASGLDSDTSLGTDAGGATAGANNVIITTFSATASLSRRGIIAISDVLGSNYDHMQGRYLALLRYRSSASSTTFGLQLRQGFGITGSFADGVFEEVKAVEYVTPPDGTNFYFADLGIVTFPPGQFRNVSSGNWDNATLLLYAERLAGSGSLTWDRLIFIPSDHMLKLESGETAGTDVANFYVHADDDFSGLQTTSLGVPERGLIGTPTDFYIPVAPNFGGKIVVAATRTGGISNKDDTLDFSMNVFHRWLDYRGS